MNEQKSDHNTNSRALNAREREKYTTTNVVESNKLEKQKNTQNKNNDDASVEHFKRNKVHSKWR